MRMPSERLQDILEAIEHIERYTAQGREVFENNELIQTWVVHHLQIIGEAVNMLPETTRALEPNVPWRSIIGMRHILVHQYFEIDLTVTWGVVIHHLPFLKSAVLKLINHIEASAHDGL